MDDNQIIDRIRANNKEEKYAENIIIIDKLVECQGLEGVKIRRNLFQNIDLLNECVVSYYRGNQKVKAKSLYEKILAEGRKDTSVKSAIEENFAMLSYNMDCFEKVIDKGGMAIAIMCYKIKLVGQWDIDSSLKGITGSEEAVIYASRILSEKGHQITVYGEPPDNSLHSLPFANPRFVNIDTFSNDGKKYDVIIFWRRTDFTIAKNRGKYVLFWPHDPPTGKFAVEGLDGCLFLSEYQRDKFYEINPDLREIPHTVCGNGFWQDQFPSPAKFTNPYSCMYASNYSRGLEILLKIWPDIYAEFPQATLDIYYGRQTWGQLSKEKMAEIDTLIKNYEKKGVKEHGIVGHQVLADAMQTTSILAYPCISSGETFCITVLKAQVAGMVPVTTRIGALKETVSPEAPTLDMENDDLGKRKYRKLLLHTMRNIDNYDRNKFVEFGNKYTWENCVHCWLKLVKNIKSSKQEKAP